MLRKSDKVFRRALEAGRIGIWELDLDSGILTWSLDFVPEEKKPRIQYKGELADYLRRVNRFDKLRFLKLVNQIATKKSQTMHTQFRVRDENDEVHWVECVGSLNISRPEIIKGIWMNITRRMVNIANTQTQYRLSKILISEVPLEKAAMNILTVLVRGLGWDGGIFDYKNVQLARYPKKKITGVKTRYFLPINVGKICCGEIILYSKVNKIISSETQKVFTIIAQQLSQFIARETAVEELLQSKNQLETIFENISDGVIVYDEDQNPILSNSKAREMFGPTLHAELKDVRKLKNGSTIMRVNDSWYLEKDSNVKDSRGKTNLYINIFDDITEQIAGQNQRELFLGVAGHEIKTPLMSIKAYSQLSRREHKTYYLDKIDEQVNHIARIVNEILDVTRVRSGKMEMHKTPVDYTDFVKKLVDNFTKIYPKRKIKVNISDSIVLTVDKDRISQVLNNLLTNAIKYSPEDSIVSVTGSKKQKEYIVEVKDQGVGIDGAKIDYLFDSYYRIKDSPTKNIDGLGLGLYVSASIIKEHEGKIWVKSKQGEGSTFYFSLPIKDK